MNRLNIYVTLVISFLTSLTTAVVCVLILATSSVGGSSTEEVYLPAKLNNTADLASDITANASHYKTQEELIVIASRLSQLEKNIMSNTQELLLLQQDKTAQQADSFIATQQSTALSESEFVASDDSQAPLSDQQAQLDFEDAMILFELEDVDENATAQLALNLEDFGEHSQSMGVENLVVQNQECRGQSCRVDLNYQGEGDALRLLPALLAAETTQSIKLNLSQAGDQTHITALIR